MQWQKRRLQGVKRCYLARLAPQSPQDPLYIVPKAAAEHSWAGLDSRGVFIVQVPGTPSLPLAVSACASVRSAPSSVRKHTHVCRAHLRVGGLAGAPAARAHGG